ncbi:MAG: histidinol-phosphate transaminase [Methanobrevibacter sp.]|jgi:histidinol-phosphate aminotransferase|nr:histidinol-phosphate transaminase [Candidatus Methanovirga basalitermitum]
MEIREIVKELDSYVPGISQEEIAKEFNLDKNEIIKLGSNESPWGSSKKAIDAIWKNLNQLNRYPETNLEDLKELIADYSNTKTENVIVGGDGADEIIDILAKTFIEDGDEFIVSIPTYTYYEFGLKPYGAVPVYGRWDLSNNSLDVSSVLEAISDKTKMIFLCSPNNPTGGVIPKENIERILKETDALVVVDEAYVEYSDEDNVDLIGKYSNICILRTMSKALGLAGLRIGYGLSNPTAIEFMHRVKPIFSLTRPSYMGALETFKDNEFIEESIRKGIESRDYLYGEILKIPVLHVFKSKSNFILINIEKSGLTATELSRKLLKKGVIVRDCSSFQGLDEYWIRVSIGTLNDDKRFINILKDVLLIEI